MRAVWYCHLFKCTATFLSTMTIHITDDAVKTYSIKIHTSSHPQDYLYIIAPDFDTDINATPHYNH